jgi:hypothetical protein
MDGERNGATAIARWSESDAAHIPSPALVAWSKHLVADLTRPLPGPTSS